MKIYFILGCFTFFFGVVLLGDGGVMSSITVGIFAGALFLYNCIMWSGTFKKTLNASKPIKLNIKNIKPIAYDKKLNDNNIKNKDKKAEHLSPVFWAIILFFILFLFGTFVSLYIVIYLIALYYSYFTRSLKEFLAGSCPLYGMCVGLILSFGSSEVTDPLSSFLSSAPQPSSFGNVLVAVICAPMVAFFEILMNMVIGTIIGILIMLIIIKENPANDIDIP